MRLLVLGGLGFIGLKLARTLLGLGHEVTVVDNLSVQIHGELPALDLPDLLNSPNGLKVLRLDVRDLASRAEVLEGIDVVYHLAAETGTAQSMYRIAHYVGVNELGTAVLLEAMAQCSRRPRRVVLASSRSVYGEGAYVRADTPGRLVQPPSRQRAQLLAGQWELSDSDGQALSAVATPESLGFAPGSVYASTKAAQELLLRGAAAALDFDCSILRFQNVYGEGQSLRNPYTGIISIFFNRARQGLAIDLYEDGQESRDFVHVDDVVAALVVAGQADCGDGQAINIGSGQATTVEVLARELARVAGLTVPIGVTGQFRVGDIRHCFADISRARQVLGVVPQIGLTEGLTRFVAWARTQPVHVDQSSTAAAELRARNLSN